MSPSGHPETLDETLGTSIFMAGRPAILGALIAIVAAVRSNSFRNFASA